MHSTAAPGALMQPDLQPFADGADSDAVSANSASVQFERDTPPGSSGSATGHPLALAAVAAEEPDEAPVETPSSEICPPAESQPEPGSDSTALSAFTALEAEAPVAPLAAAVPPGIAIDAGAAASSGAMKAAVPAPATSEVTNDDKRQPVPVAPSIENDGNRQASPAYVTASSELTVSSEQASAQA